MRLVVIKQFNFYSSRFHGESRNYVKQGELFRSGIRMDGVKKEVNVDRKKGKSYEDKHNLIKHGAENGDEGWSARSCEGDEK